MYLSAIFLIYLPLVLGQNLDSTIVVTNTTTEPTPITYEYIIKLVFGLEKEKIPEFLINNIFDYSKNITTQDVILLYKLETFNLTYTIDVLGDLHYDPYRALSIDGLEQYLVDFNISFSDFYKAVFNNLEVTGLPLRNFLKELGINTGEFSDAITFGEEDPLQIFKKGNFSEVNLYSALQKITKTPDDLFIACRNVILSNTKAKTTEELFNILKKHNFDKVEAMNLWEILELDVENEEGVTVFTDLLDELKFNLENVSYLGILTSNKVAVNKNIHERIKEKLQLSKIFAQSLYENITVELKDPKQYYENIIFLNLETDNFTNFVEISNTTKDLKNCQIVTLKNDTLISQYIEKVTNKKATLEVNIEEFNITDLIEGSPLICDNKVYGLSRIIDDNKIVFDAFIIHSGVSTTLFNPLIIVISFVIYLKL